MTESRPDENETNPVPQEISDSEETNPEGEAANDKRQKCCAWARFQGVAKAQGYGFGAAGNASFFMSNVFLSTSIIYLASKEAGCVDENDEIILDCETRVYGFYPSSFVTNIAALGGLLAAFFMPLIGAIVDYTSHRRNVGRCVAITIFVLQLIQIGTVSATWFPMAILQAIVGALFYLHYLLMVSYLPDIARYDVDVPTMTRFNRSFFGLQFGGEVVYILLVVGISIVVDLNSVQTGQLGQLVGSLWISVAFYNAWEKFPEMEGRHALPEGKTNILLEGFRQNWRTCVQIHRHSKALQWFFISIILVEAGTTALLPISITYMSRVLKYDTVDIGITFLLALMAAVPGAAFGSMLSRRTNPCTAVKIAVALAAVYTALTIMVLRDDNWFYLGYIGGLIWGFIVGGFYAAEQLFFTLCLPEGQEAELAGFFVYCTIILTWLPPLLFSVVVERGAADHWGLMPPLAFQVLGLVSLFRVPPWNQVLEGTKHNLLLLDDHAIDNGIDVDCVYEETTRGTTERNEDESSPFQQQDEA